MNQYVGKDKINELRLKGTGLHLEYYKEYDYLRRQHPKATTHIINSHGSTGEVINDSNNCIYSFQINNCDTCKYVSYLHNAEGSGDIDYASPYGANHSYNLCSSTGTCNSLSTFLCRKNYNIYYCLFCFDSNNLFGCIGLRNKSYCIFNKQYTKEDYEIQVAKIIAHMQTTGERGDFFHPSLSPFGYNETVAQEYLPLNKGELETHGYHRSDYNSDPSLPEGVQTIKKSDYTDEQRSTLLQDNNLETKVFICSVSGRPYRLQKAEVEFYRKHHLPIPDKHPDVRHEERMKLRPGRTLFLRSCDCCNKEMLSVYSKKVGSKTSGEVVINSTLLDSSDLSTSLKVYCESCYQKEMYA